METTLNDFIHKPSDFLAMSDDLHRFILIEPIKDFIKELKKEFCYDWLNDKEECNYIEGCSSCKRIDKLTGFANVLDKDCVEDVA